MSGPVSTADAPATTASGRAEVCPLEVVEGRAFVAGGFGLQRVLPRRRRRTVSSWCFLDHMGPGDVRAGHALDFGPHPHVGLQTVTWLFEGAVLHRDSLGSEQLVRPGQLNLMTAGRGVSHSEETSGIYEGPLHGVQLWVALPSSTRDGDPGFEHHPVLPRVELGNGSASVPVGQFAGATSPARRDTDHFGAVLDLRPGRCVVPLGRGFEHALVALRGRVSIGPHVLEAGRLGYLGTGREEVPVDTREPATVLLLGGPPFPEPLLMWWNYVARTREEITAAHDAWTAGSARFGTVASQLPRVDAPGPPWGPPAR